MGPASEKTLMMRGILDSAPFLVVLIPFAMLFGVVATEAGLSLAQVVGFSVVVIAGAAQFTALQLLQEGVPILVILLTSLAVNLRMAMYSAALTPYLGQAPFWKRGLVAYLIVDQNFAITATAYDREPNWSLGDRFAYFIGVSIPVVPAWYAATLLGALLGSALPEWLQLDFVLPLAFLSIVAPALRTLAHVCAAGTSVVLALAFAFLPYSLGLLVAGIGAMIVGAQIEKMMERGHAR